MQLNLYVSFKTVLNTWLLVIDNIVLKKNTRLKKTTKARMKPVTLQFVNLVFNRYNKVY